MARSTFVELENTLAQIMAKQEASGFPLDLEAAKKIHKQLSRRFNILHSAAKMQFYGLPGKTKTPKRPNKSKGHQAGCPYSEIIEFNPTSRQHIAYALKLLGVSFDKTTATGATKVDEDTLAEIHENHCNSAVARKVAERFARLLKLQKWLGQLSNGKNSWLNKVEADGCIHHSCGLATQTGRNAHRNPNLGQVVSAPWARRLFLPHAGHVLVGVDLEGLELRVLGHYLADHDNGRFGDIVVNGDIHQINADSVGCSRKLVKSLTYGFIYGAGDAKLGKLLYPTMMEGQQKIKGKEVRQKFLDAIPGLEPLIASVKADVRLRQEIEGLDGRPVYCSAEHAGLNYCLQGAGAVLSKRWVIMSYDKLVSKYEYGRDFTFCAYVHDEIQTSCRPEIAEDVKALIESASLEAGAFYDFKVPITASGVIGANWQETH